jgi:hypothetical protein
VKSAAAISIGHALPQSLIAIGHPGPAGTGELPVARQPWSPLPTIDFETGSAAPPRSNSPPCYAKDTTSALEAMPHLANRITRLWKSRDLNTLIHELLLDSRDGNRQGFPREVAKELMFLARMNVIVRANDAAPLLGISIGDACRLIETGDHAAIKHVQPAPDIWGAHDRMRHPQSSARLASRGTDSSKQVKAEMHQAPVALSPSLIDSPPVPPSVCLDLTAPKTLRHGKGINHPDDGDLMEQGFFRCIAKELGTLKIPQLVLSDLGNVQRCTWLPSAISFAKNRCHFPSVILHIDPLSALEPLLVLAITAGLDNLVINFNLASGKWRARAEALTESDPEYFRKQIQRLLDSRDQVTRKTGHHCAISVVQINHKSVFHLSRTFLQLSRQEGLEPYRHIAETKRDENMGACHCWSPFIEAHIRTNGHLVACAQDHSGYSYTANLKEVTFTDAWNSQVFRNTRQRVLLGEKPGRLCEICPHRPTPSI